MTRYLRAVTACVLVAAALPLLAAEADRKRPIYLEADRVEIDDESGISTYSGDVRIVQGSMELNASKVVLYLEKRETTRYVATGTPARFKERPEDADDDLVATAPTIEYRVRVDELHLLGGGEVSQGPNTFTGETIVYLVNQNQIRATGGSGSRVTMTIEPEADAEPAPAPAPQPPATRATDDAAP